MRSEVPSSPATSAGDPRAGSSAASSAGSTPPHDPQPDPGLAPPLIEGLPFTSPWLLAPMEGVTAPSFRDLVLERNGPSELGGAFTEFVRVIDGPVAKKELRKHLGERRFRAPVGLQLMGSDLDAVEGSARHVAELGVPVLDLNFGCPARGALRGCAGAAALREPKDLEETVRRAVRGVEGRMPVTAKIRAGFDHARDVEVIARAAEAGGAAMLTIHCRTRREGYQEEVDWTRIQRAVDAVAIPVAGNGSAWLHTDLERMRRETGCRLVMVGRGSMRDPWIFSGKEVSQAEAAEFLLDYCDVLSASGARPKAVVGLVKQLFQLWVSGGIMDEEGARLRWLRRTDFDEFLRDLHALSDRVAA